ncbi:Acetolactate synthase, mitochondrial [Allomyces javanicus]|nr:Acetolactate synthase, mitochondrial [Allomyces javanicus]
MLPTILRASTVPSTMIPRSALALAAASASARSATARSSYPAAFAASARSKASLATPSPALNPSAPPPLPPTSTSTSSSKPASAAAAAAAAASSPAWTTPAAATPAATTDADADLDASYIGMTGGEIVHQMLIKHDVKVCFGYPGGAILPVFDAIYESPHFEFVLPRHEQGAGHMAEGYARATGRPGVVIVTSGPGATNVVTPLQDALSDGTPLVVFTGQVPTAAIGSDAFQEADVIGITRACTKWNVMVKDVAELPRRITEAFTIATSGRPGPVLVDLPKDVTATVLRKAIPRVPDVPRFPGRPPNFLSPHYTDAATGASPGLLATLSKVSKAIQTAKKPIIYAGQGILSSPHGPRLLAELATKAQIPVTTTLQGLGAFDEHDPLSLHMLGMHGSAYANLAIQDADVILALGARFDDRVTGTLAKFAPAARQAERDGTGGIFHFEVVPKNINKTVQVTDAVEGDVVANMRHLLALVPEITADAPNRAPWLAQIAEWKQKHPFRYGAPQDPGHMMRPQYVIDVLNRMTADKKADTVITTGVGQHQMWAAQYYRWTHPRTLITSGGLGTMGYGLPAAIGAKVALGHDKTVIDIDGDASFSMTAMELQTAAQYNIGVKVLLLNNDFQGMVKQWQDLFYEERFSGTPMVNPDFVKLAEAMGVKALRASTPEELEVAMAEFLNYNDGPVLLEARVCKREHVYPMVPAGKGLHEMVLGSPEDK